MTFPYRIGRGDTWERIALRYGLPVSEWFRVSRELRERQGLYGQRQVSAGRKAVQPAYSSYVLKAGDTIDGVAQRFGLEGAELLEVNPGIHHRHLRIGQTIVLPQVHEIMQAEGEGYGYAALVSQLKRLQRDYPFLETGSVGRTVLGQTIPYIRIGSGSREVHYNGAFHANEWMTSLLLMQFVESYAAAWRNGDKIAGRDARRLAEESSLWIVPMVNPDGVDLSLHGVASGHPYYERLLAWNGGSADFSGWKANIRGVDLNDQFPAYWETERDRRDVAGPGPRDYTGASPLSEPEAAAMAAFTASRDFRLVMAFHTQGREIYWNYRDYEPGESAAMAQRLEELSGYRAVKLTGSDAGYKDWFIREYRKPGFTIEAGFGVNPLPVEQLGSIYRELLPLLVEGLLL
ncbi:M14 family metallopeptidase [Paenibacillus filicis]|uniref:M14 family metallopeptidase n=1 Tax=Paenibacillus filicis TaxID=669464 RepID=A0ABU9DED3_9BACL